MEYQDFIKKVINGGKFLQEDGFELDQIKTRDYVFSFEKKNPREGVRIVFQCVDYGNRIQVSGLQVQKRFNDVERELAAVLGGDLESFYTIARSASCKGSLFGLKCEETDNNVFFMITDVQNSDSFLEVLQYFYHEEAGPFLSKYRDLNYLNDVLKKISRDEVGRLINNSGNTAFYRELIIKILTGSNDIVEYYDFIKSELSFFKGNKTFELIMANLELFYNRLSIK